MSWKNVLCSKVADPQPAVVWHLSQSLLNPRWLGEGWWQASQIVPLAFWNGLP